MKRWDRLLTLIPHKTAVIADIGTDHGYLAINAIRNNHIKKVYATDIAEEPLKQAAINLELAHLNSQQVQLIKSDGLDFLTKIPETNIDYVVIAGLGSKTIKQIIEKPRSQINRYLLLSNNEISSLRNWSHKHNFKIEFEDFFYDRKNPYWLILINKNLEAQPITNFDFGDWQLWYKNNTDYQHYLSALKARYLSYQKQLTRVKDMEKNKNQIKKIENYLKQWN